MRKMWLVFSFAPAAVSGDRWFASDKIEHFFASAFVQSMSYGTLRAAGAGNSVALAGASAATLAVGVGKEIHDRDVKGDFSAKDLTWDLAGGAAASVLLVRTRR